MIIGKTGKLPGKHLLVKTLLFILPALVLFNPSLLASQKINPKNVLVLASYKSTAPVGYLWERGIRSVFEAETSQRIETHVEYLDLNSFNDDHYIRMLQDVLLHKYAKSMPDLIIPIYNRALGFVLEHGSEIFPEVPVVFAGVEQRYIERQKLGSNVTGLLSTNSYVETLELVFKLHPNTKNVAVISGAGKIGGTWGKNALNALRPYDDQVHIFDLTGLPIQTILEKVANLPDRTVVLYVTLLEDGAGKRFTAPTSVSIISEAANAPVYSFWELVLGHGIVGGYLSSAEEKGKELAEFALGILSGERKINSSPIRESKLRYMFDWSQLKRWSIPEDALPPNSIVRFKKFTVWDRYKGRIMGVIALIVFQTLIISYLLYQHRIRRRAEQTLDERLQFETLIAEVSSEFSNLAVDKVDWKINDALSRIGTYMNVERSFLFRFNWEKTEFRISHLWEAEGIRKDQVVRGVLVREFFPWLADNLPRGKDIVIPDVEELSDAEEACKEYEYCRHIGIQSFLILPIQVADSPLCAIGLDSIHSKKKWSKEDINHLRILGEVFANTIARSHAEEKIKAAELKYRTVADFTYDWEYWANVDGKLEYVSPSCERISGYCVQDFIDNPALIREIIVPEDLEKWDEHYCASENELKPREIQLRIQRRDGETRWIEHVCQPVIDNKGSLAGLRVSNRDITERKQAELELQGAYAEITELKDQLETESAYLQEEINLEKNFENIIGQSEELKYVLYQVEQVASTDSSVLILGETGTGKELVARAIHKLSSRSNRVLVKVNCATLPAELIESELFGREKGAFTGAATTQIGRFELAKGSTILLDEIGELPLTLQAKLLQVYESGEFERLGSPKTLYSDARIIASTNRVLEEEVHQGRFREDLWYRIKVFTVTLPPLRQRKADIPLLIKWFMDQLSRKTGKPAVEIPKHTIQALQDYHWPGNVRELKNMVESALITGRGNKMHLELPKISDHTISDFKPFEEMERDYILQVLKAKSWKVQGTNSAASILGMNPNTLRARIKKLGIKKPSE
jgi:PAS domain S-box-containing protein